MRFMACMNLVSTSFSGSPSVTARSWEMPCFAVAFLATDRESVWTDEELLALLRLLLVRGADRPADLDDFLGEDRGVAEGKEAELSLR